MISSLLFMVLVLISITVHEYAHGWAAVKLGDTTPLDEGRLSLNPLKHIDIFGTIVLPIILQLTAGISFGYAKPVPINPYHFRNPKKDIMWVGLAGPAANILIAITFSLIVRAVSNNSIITQLILSLIATNILLAIFNILPIPPLDGSKILAALLPSRWYYNYLNLQMYGIILILLLSVSGCFDRFLMPALIMAMKALGLGDLI